MKRLFYPINIDAKNIATKLITPQRLLASLLIFVISLLITIFSIFRNYFINPETKNIGAGILVTFINIYITQFLIFKVCLRERLLKKYYDKIVSLQNKPVYKLFNIVNIDKSISKAPVFVCSNGYRLIGFKLFPDSVVGKMNPKEIENHYNVSKSIYGALAKNFRYCWHLNLTNTHGYDKRWEHLIRINSNNKCPILKQIMNNIIIHNQSIKNNLASDYFIVAEHINYRPLQFMVDAVISVAQLCYEGKYIGWDFINEDKMTEICTQLFATDKTFIELLDTTEQNVINKKYVWVTRIIKTDGTQIDMTNQGVTR